MQRNFGANDTTKVLYDRKSKNTLEVTLNHEKALNSLDLDMIKSLLSNREAWIKDQNLFAIVFVGAGPKAFCAGGDVKSLYDARVKEDNMTVIPPILDNFFRNEFTLDYRIASMRPIQVSIWDGMVLGGGVGLTIHSSFRIATEKSMFAMPE